MNPVSLIVIGLVVGWLIEWVIDWVWWRRPKKIVTQDTIPELKEMLDGMSPEGDLHAKLATWFDHVMERSSGEYKRRVSKRALLIGTILAFAFNVDSIQIATSLWREPTLRQVIVAQASNPTNSQVNNQAENPEQPIPLDQVKQLGIPVGWSTNLPTNGQELERLLPGAVSR